MDVICNDKTFLNGKPKLCKDTLALLEDIEKGIDPENEDDFIKQWDDFVHHKFTGSLFKATRKKTFKTDYEYKSININDAVEDYELMLVDQMQAVSRSLESGHGLLSVRTNYGTGILPSLFGTKVFIMPRNTNTLPAAVPFHDEDKMRELLTLGVPDSYNGLGKDVFTMGEYFLEVFKDYPKIQKYVSLFHPDTQGPMDIAELLWGSDILYAMYDEPDFVKDVLSLVNKTYIDFMDKWYKLCPQELDWSSHWGNIAYIGKILIRTDSAMNVSPDMYEEFVRPYDMELLEHFGGGAIHFCGRGDHYIDKLTSIPKLNAVNLSQPHLNDMEKIFANTIDKGIQIVGLSSKWLGENDLRNGDYKHNISI